MRWREEAVAFTQLLCGSGGELPPPSSERVTPTPLTPYPLSVAAQRCWSDTGVCLGHQNCPTILMLAVCPWAPMEPSPRSRLSPAIQKPGFGGHTVLCPHSSAQPYGGQTKVLMHLHPFRRDGGGMVCSLGKTSPLATEMLKVAPISQCGAPHHHHYNNA